MKYLNKKKAQLYGPTKNLILRANHSKYNCSLLAEYVKNQFRKSSFNSLVFIQQYGTNRFSSILVF